MKINKYIENTKKVIPGYWESTCRQRLAGGAGSCYPQFASIEAIENAITSADWEETHHPDVMPGCRVFKAQLPGLFGLVDISTLPKSTVFTADDRKGTGKISLTVHGVPAVKVETTYLIVGDEQGQQVVFTFHPGEPVQPSQVTTHQYKHGEKITMKKALKLGFKWAKLV